MVYSIKFTLFNPQTEVTENCGSTEFRGNAIAVENAILKKAKSWKKPGYVVQSHVMSIIVPAQDLVEYDDHFQDLIDVKVNKISGPEPKAKKPVKSVETDEEEVF